MNSTTLINVTNLDNIKKQRHHFADKGLYSQTDVRAGWTIKKARH